MTCPVCGAVQGGESVELITDGADTDVNVHNIHLYVHKYAELRMLKCQKKALEVGLFLPTIVNIRQKNHKLLVLDNMAKNHKLLVLDNMAKNHKLLVLENMAKNHKLLVLDNMANKKR
jgi:hypothetical protein